MPLIFNLHTTISTFVDIVCVRNNKKFTKCI